MRVTELTRDEEVRAQKLLDAQAKAADLFGAVEEGGLIAPGVRETAASDAIRGMFDLMDICGEVVIGEGIKDTSIKVYSNLKGIENMQKKLEDSSVEVTLRYRSLLQT